MDMWPPYIGSVEEHTEARIVFDKFHIVADLNKAVDQVRRAEQRELLQAGDSRLKRSRYLWLMNRQRMTAKQRRTFAALRRGPAPGGAGLGDQGDGEEPVGLHSPGLGRTDVEALVQLGDSQPPRASQARCTHDQTALGGGHQRRHLQRDQRPCRSHQLQNPMDQTPSLRLSKPAELPRSHLLPSRWPRSLPRRTLCPTQNPEEPKDQEEPLQGKRKGPKRVFVNSR